MPGMQNFLHARGASNKMGMNIEQEKMRGRSSFESWQRHA